MTLASGPVHIRDVPRHQRMFGSPRTPFAMGVSKHYQMFAEVNILLLFNHGVIKIPQVEHDIKMLDMQWSG